VAASGPKSNAGPLGSLLEVGRDGSAWQVADRVIADVLVRARKPAGGGVHNPPSGGAVYEQRTYGSVGAGAGNRPGYPRGQAFASRRPAIMVAAAMGARRDKELAG